MFTFIYLGCVNIFFTFQFRCWIFLRIESSLLSHGTCSDQLIILCLKRHWEWYYHNIVCHNISPEKKWTSVTRRFNFNLSGDGCGWCCFSVWIDSVYSLYADFIIVFICYLEDCTLNFVVLVKWQQRLFCSIFKMFLDFFWTLYFLHTHVHTKYKKYY